MYPIPIYLKKERLLGDIHTNDISSHCIIPTVAKHKYISQILFLCPESKLPALHVPKSVAQINLPIPVNDMIFSGFLVCRIHTWQVSECILQELNIQKVGSCISNWRENISLELDLQCT